MSLFFLLNPKTPETVTPPPPPPPSWEGKEFSGVGGSIKFAGNKEYKETDPWEEETPENVIGPVEPKVKRTKVLKAKKANKVSESETISRERVTALEMAASIVRSPELEKLKEALNSTDTNPIEVLKLVSRASTKAKEVSEYEKQIAILEKAEAEAREAREFIRRETELADATARELARKKKILEEEEEELLLLLAALDLLD